MLKINGEICTRQDLYMISYNNIRDWERCIPRTETAFSRVIIRMHLPPFILQSSLLSQNNHTDIILQSSLLSQKSKQSYRHCINIVGWGVRVESVCRSVCLFVKRLNAVKRTSRCLKIHNFRGISVQ